MNNATSHCHSTECRASDGAIRTNGRVPTASPESARSPRRHAVRRAAILAAGGMLLALAACESTPADETAGSTTETTANAAQAETTTGTDDQVVEARMTTADCEKPGNGRVHFRVAGAVFAVPGGDVRTVIPSGVTPGTPAKQVVEKLRTETEAGAGCPETPLDAALLAVAGPTSDPLVGDELLLFRSSGIAGPYGDLTRKMLANPDKCQEAGDELLACQVVSRDGDSQQRLLYLVSTDKDQKLAFGGPLAARCIVVGEKLGCEILDELPGGVGLRAPLKGVPENSTALAGAHERALAVVRPLRL